MTCLARREGDEMYCAKCQLRWSVAETFPCPVQAGMQATVRALAATAQRAQDRASRRGHEWRRAAVYATALYQRLKLLNAQGDAGTAMLVIAEMARLYLVDTVTSAGGRLDDYEAGRRILLKLIAETTHTDYQPGDMG